MKLKSNFLTGLDFKPLDLWPDTVPALALGNQLLCGFQLDSNHPVFEHADQGFAQNVALLKTLYSSLTLPELARLIKSATFQNYFEATSLLKTYGFHSSPELLEILELLTSTTDEFQNFVSSKKFGAQELIPLTSLNSEQVQFVTKELRTADESKQDSVKRLELLSDLIQMGQDLTSLTRLSLKALHEKRYPVTTTRDQSLEAATLPWPSQVRSQFKRRGDKAGFEVNFFAGTPAELSKLAQNLTKVAEAWNTKP